MATTDYWSSADLKGVAVGGFINEDVMQKVIDILDIDLPLTSRIGVDKVKNSYTEWTNFTYAAPILTNAAVDGEDATTYNATAGARLGNRCQISKKVVAVTTRARNSDVIGTSDEFTEQLMRQTEHLRRDVEATALYNQATATDDGVSTAGKAGGLNAWLKTNVKRAAGGASGGFSAGNVTAATLGTAPRALSEADIRDVCQGIYQQGFNPSIMMSRPAVIRRVSEYMFTSTARVGIQQTDTGKSGPSTAVGSVKVFITDFDVELMFVSNRIQTYMNSPTNTNDTLFILTPEQLRFGHLHGYKTEPLAKLGLADRSQVSVDWTLKVLAEQAQGGVCDINAGTAMVA